MDLLDALWGNNHAPSVVELSLNPLFREGYSNLFKTISECLTSEVFEQDELQLEYMLLPKENHPPSSVTQRLQKAVAALPSLEAHRY
jgi:hypothetical protein